MLEGLILRNRLKFGELFDATDGGEIDAETYPKSENIGDLSISENIQLL